MAVLRKHKSRCAEKRIFREFYSTIRYNSPCKPSKARENVSYVWKPGVLTPQLLTARACVAFVQQRPQVLGHSWVIRLRYIGSLHKWAVAGQSEGCPGLARSTQFPPPAEIVDHRLTIRYTDSVENMLNGSGQNAMKNEASYVVLCRLGRLCNARTYEDIVVSSVPCTAHHYKDWHLLDSPMVDPGQPSQHIQLNFIVLDITKSLA